MKPEHTVHIRIGKVNGEREKQPSCTPKDIENAKKRKQAIEKLEDIKLAKSLKDEWDD